MEHPVKKKIPLSPPCSKLGLERMLGAKSETKPYPTYLEMISIALSNGDPKSGLSRAFISNYIKHYYSVPENLLKRNLYRQIKRLLGLGILIRNRFHSEHFKLSPKVKPMLKRLLDK